MCLFGKKRDEPEVVDDGRTIANMNVEGFAWYRSPKSIESKRKLLELNLTKKERRAMILGALLAYFPYYLAFLGAFTLVYLLFLLFAKLT